MNQQNFKDQQRAKEPETENEETEDSDVDIIGHDEYANSLTT